MKEDTELLWNRYALFVESLQAPFVVDSEFKAKCIHAVLGIAGEAGELVELFKKGTAYKRPIPKAEVLEELGDLFFYLTMLMMAWNISLWDVMRSNEEKLRARYPNGFSLDDANAPREKEK